MNVPDVRIDSSAGWLSTFAAELTAAVYVIALRNGAALGWLELELGLWKAVTDTIDRWAPELAGAASQYFEESRLVGNGRSSQSERPRIFCPVCGPSDDPVIYE
jgi:hypothetical protein